MIILHEHTYIIQAGKLEPENQVNVNLKKINS